MSKFLSKTCWDTWYTRLFKSLQYLGFMLINLCDYKLAPRETRLIIKFDKYLRDLDSSGFFADLETDLLVDLTELQKLLLNPSGATRSWSWRRASKIVSLSC